MTTRSTFCLVLILACTPDVSAQHEQEFAFQSNASDEQRTYAAVLTMPQPGAANGAAVMLLGGGLVHDADWSTPGVVDVEGDRQQLTISGNPHADGRTLAEAFATAGFVVFRFSLIHERDALATAQPGMAEPVPIEQGFTIAADALAAFRKRSPEAGERLILVTHSLGALRAAQLMDQGVVATVWLAPAYATALPESTRRLVERTLPLVGALPKADRPTVEDADFNGDAQLAGWELADWALRQGRLEAVAEATYLGRPWPIERIEASGIPLLAIFGELDTITMHAPAIARRAEQSELSAKVRVFDDLGHNLSQEQDGRVGPINEKVVDELVRWCRDIAEQGDGAR